MGWEVEYQSKNRDNWMADWKIPYYPTPNPPDSSKPVDYVRYSTLPCEEIAEEVNKNTNYKGFVDWNGSPGNYLCGYMAYLDMWYQDMHSSPADPYICYAAGFIHVGSEYGLKTAMKATNITIRETIKYLNKLIPSSKTLTTDADSISANCGGVVTFSLNAGAYNKNRDYILLGSASGSKPGTPLPGGISKLPLNWDSVTDFIASNINTLIFQNFSGTLDKNGTAVATLSIRRLSSALVGTEIVFAFACNNPFDFVSNPVTLKIVE